MWISYYIAPLSTAVGLGILAAAEGARTARVGEIMFAVGLHASLLLWGGGGAFSFGPAR